MLGRKNQVDAVIEQPTPALDPARIVDPNYRASQSPGMKRFKFTEDGGAGIGRSMHYILANDEDQARACLTDHLKREANIVHVVELPD